MECALRRYSVLSEGVTILVQVGIVRVAVACNLGDRLPEAGVSCPQFSDWVDQVKKKEIG